jgi:hypothetical protein
MFHKLRQFVILLIVLGMAGTPLVAGERAAKGTMPGSPWTLDEALQQSALYPHDAYLQYVALQLARREGDQELQRASRQIQDRARRMMRRSRAGRRQQVDLFNLTSGALAVQESLQLDAMTAGVVNGLNRRDPRFPGRRQTIYRGTPATSRSMRQLGLAMHNYCDAQGSFPAAATYDSNGQPLLSWRVHLLPYLGQQNLYRQFRIDQPWDSPHNRALIEKMPDLYKDPGSQADGQQKTRYQVPVGQSTIFPGRKTVRLSEIRDGTSNTILLVQVTKEHAVVWTKPEDWALDPNAPTKGIAGDQSGWFHVVMADGSLRSLPTTVDLEQLRCLLDRQDGKPIDWEAIYARRSPQQSTQREPANIDISTLIGPTVRSLPFEQMLAGRNPPVSELAAAVPEDFYYVRFRSLGKLLELAGSSNLWATHLLSQSTQDASSHQIDEHLKTQLCVQTNDLLKPFYDLVVREVGLTGSDLFLREGADVALLFRYQQEAVFKAQMDQFLASAEQAHPKSSRSSGRYRDVAYVHLTSPDRQVHVYSAYPGSALHIRCNSQVALERIIDTIQGPEEELVAGSELASKAPGSLAATAEFRYMRTLYEKDAAEEDAFIYLSDAFIRELVGPVKKITERRRMLCYNHLRMLGHAALLYRTEHAGAPESLDQLITSKCLPEDFGAGQLVCPDDGRYLLSDDGMKGLCTVHGRANQLTPCCEIAADRITATEQTLYQSFLEEYNQYWRTFFDPIGIRVQLTPEKYRLETIVLPLIDNSIYTTLAEVLGGVPGQLDNLPVPKRNIFSIALKFDKDKLIVADAESARQRSRSASLNHLKQIALAFLNHESAYHHFPPATEKSINLSWRVHLLPFLEQKALYQRFNLDEPWDSPHNIELLKEMPAVYGAEGTTTRIVGFSGEDALFGKTRGMSIAAIRDGTSNTILVVEAGPDKAVPWTKPVDLPFDPVDPGAALGDISIEGFKVAFADGHARVLPKEIDAARLKALITYRGGEPITRVPSPPRQRRPRAIVTTSMIHEMLSEFGAPKEEIGTLGIGEFLLQGIGDQISFHLYDAEPTFTFSVTQFAGRMLSGWGRRGFDDDMMFLLPLVSSLNSPVYLAIPIADKQIVDQFLARLDRILAKAARKPMRGGFFSIDTDFYRLPAKGEPVRCFAWEFFSFRFRFFVARIDENLVIATQPFVLDDLLEQTATSSNAHPNVIPNSTAHVLVRVRPENWNRVLADYRLGWAESNRQSCLKNLGPLSSIARAYNTEADQLVEVARQMIGVRYYCPEGGHYEVAPMDGNGSQPSCSVLCSIHGTAAEPRQSTAPEKESQLNRLLSRFKGLTAALTFTQEGLRARLELERKAK